jgi:hypothetical protein
MSKEPGQIDDQILLFGEGNLPPEKLAALERMEKRIRADEAAKVRAATIEECAKIVEQVECDWVDGSNRPVASPLLFEAAANIRAIRAKGAEHG